MEKMKNSGIEWIGDIPEGWEVSKIKYIADIRSENGIFNPEINQYIGLENIKSYSNEIITTGTEYQISFQSKCFKNDVMFSRLRPYLAKVLISPFDGFCTGELLQFYNFSGDKKYLYYLLLNPVFIDIVNASTYGAKMPRANTDFILNQYFPLPPPETQKRIADFLDAKCAKIDGLKNDIQKQIETLEEYKKSVITEAVTGKLKFAGINPNAKMKDSGIEWIGKIPEHWEIHPIYYYFEERKHKNSLCKEQNLLSLSYGNIIRKDINALGGLLPESFNTYNIIEKDDIVIRPTDLQNDKRSLRTGLCKEHGIITSAYITLMPKENVNSQYFHYLLHTYDIEKVFYNMGNGVRQGLNYSEFAKLLVISPTKDEQKDIVAYLDEKCSSIDSIISTKKQQLEKLEEYKKSLIFEYVTGKREVSCEFSSKTSGKKEV